MPIAKGSRSALYWKEETTFGVTPSGNFVSFPFTNETLGQSIPTISTTDIRPDRTTGALRGSNVAVGGSVTADFDVDSHLYFVRHVLGAGDVLSGTPLTPPNLAASTAYARGSYVVSGGARLYVCVIGGTTDAAITSSSLTATSGTQTIAGASSTTLTFRYVGAHTTAVYSHTLTGGSALPSYGFCIEKQILGGTTALYEQYKGLKLGSMELNIPQAGAVTATYNFVGTTSSLNGSSGIGTPTAVTSELSIGADAMVHINNSNGAAALTTDRFKDCRLTIANNLTEDAYVIGGRFRSDIPEGSRSVSGSVTLYFIDLTEYSLFVNETTFAMVISIVTGGKSIRFEMPEVKFTGDGTPKISDAGPVMATFEFTAFKAAGAHDIRAVANNFTEELVS